VREQSRRLHENNLIKKHLIKLAKISPAKKSPKVSYYE